MKKGIYLVANKNSQEMCKNLIYSIRESGCTLPIRLIHFGSTEVTSSYIINEVEHLRYEIFSDEAKQFITSLRTVLTDCPLGFLYRYLAWFLDWDEFIYSDNDVVALCNWDNLFTYLSDYDLVHADEEYKTNGMFNYKHPEKVKKLFGEFALESTITAGHIVVKRNASMIPDMRKAIDWFKQNSSIPHKHDQSLLHIASLLGNWKILNLCKPPHNWLSSWSGDYINSLQLIQSIQRKNTSISHLHYSGGNPKGNLAIQELLLSSSGTEKRLSKLAFTWLRFSSNYESLIRNYSRAKRFFARKYS